VILIEVFFHGIFYIPGTYVIKIYFYVYN